MVTPTQAQIAVIVLLNAGHPDQAQRIIGQAEKSLRPGLHCSLAAAFAAKKEYDLALNEYKAALKIEPKHAQAVSGSVEILMTLAMSHLRKKEFKQAHPYLKQALATNPDNLELQNLLATVEISIALEGGSVEDPERMIQAIEKIYLANPERLELAHKLAMLYHQCAIELEASASGTPQLVDAWERAIGYWSLVAEGDDYWELWFKGRASVYGQEIPTDKRDELRQARIKERVRQIHQQYIREYSEMNRKEQADRHRTLLARWTLEMSTTTAVHQMTDFLKSHGQPAPLAVACGPIVWDLLNTRESVQRAAQKAKKLDPENAAALEVLQSLTPLGLAKAMRKDGLLKEAVDTLTAYLETNSRDKEAKALLAELLVQQGQTLLDSNVEQAIEAFQQAKHYGANAQSVDETICQAVYDQASRLIEQDNTARATALLQLAIRSTKTGNALLQDLLAKTQTGPAIKLANEAIEGFSNDTRTYDQTVKDLERALSMLETALRTAPDSPALRKNISDLREVRDKVKASEAHRLNQLAVQQAGEAIDLAKSGQRYSAREKLRQSVRNLEAARALDPSDATIRDNLNQIQTLLNAIN